MVFTCITPFVAAHALEPLQDCWITIKSGQAFSLKAVRRSLPDNLTELMASDLVQELVKRSRTDAWNLVL